ncbi:hypothetical protein EW145_g215 [Phellinidium pouzarii]|uniref:separase n=1 Tax=Phellinidium pouzarii TaxID=167371 RepID=A0A4S4LJA8_9AGAM|nr:hypothetical protein EW145_g215 [Phellinidium pouzarii]
MATAKVKRPLAPRTNDVDKLTSRITTGLKISNTTNTRTRKVTRNVRTTKVTESPEESKATAMRSVNGVLQSLSVAVAASSSGKSSSARATLSTSASTGRAALITLRKLSPGLLDAERAALNLAGKLLALDMDGAALDVLVDVSVHLPSHYSHAEAQSPVKLGLPLSVLRLPIPTSALDPALQTCVSSYFTHALPAISLAVSAKPVLFDAFCKSLDGPASLRFWIPRLTALPSKALDALLKRTYVTLISSLASPPASPLHILKIRFHALRLLLLSAELDVTLFWEQCLKCAASYARNTEAAESESGKIAAMLACFADVESSADNRKEGKGWVAFCEYWLALAKRAGNMDLLNRIAAYIRSAASSSDDLQQLNTRSCAALIQLSAVLEQMVLSEGTDEAQLIANADSTSSSLQDLHALLLPDTVLDSKLRRAMDKCRKNGLKLLSRLQSGSQAWNAVIRILNSIIEIFEGLPDANTTVSSLDTLFQLATVGFVPQRADSCDRAYECLAHAARIIVGPVTVSTSDIRARSNYTRCLAGAFANVAGTLYKAERHSFAIRFLLQACPLSTRASALYEESHANSPCSEAEGKGKARDNFESDKDKEAWKCHKAQVYRRWELLGVCYMKIGDRKLAYDAFIQGVVTFPFGEDIPLVAESSRTSNSEIQLTAEAHRPLLTAVDRLTHLGTAELRLDASEVSLLSPLKTLGVPLLVISAMLMRQVCCLTNGGARAKPNVRMTIGALLRDLLGIYEPTRYPMRRVRVLVLVLEHTYYGGDGDADTNESQVKEAAQEAQKLLSDKASLYCDGSLSHLRKYYLAVVLLWAVLHAHRASDPVPSILRHANAALGALEMLVTQSFEEPDMEITKGKKVVRSVVRSRGGVKSKVEEVKVVSTRSGTRGAQSQVQPVQKTRTTRSASTRKPPITPKPVGSKDGVAAVVTSVAPYGPSETELTILTGLILMVSELLGLSGLILPKIQILSGARRLLEKTGDAMNEAYLQSTANLAHELLKLGMVTQAIGMLADLANSLSTSSLPSPGSVLLLLRYAEALAASGDVPKSFTVYEQASRLCEGLPEEEKEKGMSTSTRVRARVVSLERTAMAASVFAAIQDAKDDAAAFLKTLLQALRLLNRAMETLSRLKPAQKPEGSSDASDPFAMSDIKNALPIVDGPDKGRDLNATQQGSCFDGLEWRIANGLLGTLLGLSHAYACRGSAREAEYFAKQAEDLARELHAPAMTARALLRRSEVLMYLGKAEEAQKIVAEAAELVENVKGFGLDAADACRLKGDHLLMLTHEEEAQSEYVDAMKMLTKVKLGIAQINAMILKQQVWLLRDELGEDYANLLEELLALPQLSNIEVHVNSLLGRMALYDLHDRFKADMSLSSLAESTTALPMGLICENSVSYSPPQDILESLEQADEHYVSDLTRFSERDSVMNVRGAAIAAALVSTYQSTLGKATKYSPTFTSRLLDMASSITLRRELIEAISFKFPDIRSQDDLRWPSDTPASIKMEKPSRPGPLGRGLFDICLDDDDEDTSLDDAALRKYWDYILKKHQSQTFIPLEHSFAEVNLFPENWMVVSISLTEDKSALLVSRQRPQRDPVIFCVPLRGRRDDEEGHFTFDDAMTELKDIIQASDEGTRQASQIKSNDKEGKSAWWAERKQLDQRMKELVENIEFCWLGAFKTILSPPMRMPSDIVPSLRSRIEKVFKNILNSNEKKSQKAKLKLETSFLELFATLSPTCKDEELEDLVYFVLDLYHFAGLPIALAEVDVDVVTVDLRTALEEHHSRTRGHITPEPDAHAFLVLDKNVQAIPWESLPILRGASVSRVPSVAFITDRLALVKHQRGLPLDHNGRNDNDDLTKFDRAPVDPSKGYFILNPGGDLIATEGRFKGWVNDLKKVGWEGTIGHAPSEQQFLNALSRKDLVVYFGHGGAEQYARSHKVRHLQRCAATMLWGCSSGALHDMGEFDRTGTPSNYMLAGCPSLVANLWDVTDRDIDKFALAVFNKLNLDPAEMSKRRKENRGPRDGKVSIAAAVAQSREVCKLKYLTGAAVIVYGVPFYL